MAWFLPFIMRSHTQLQFRHVISAVKVLFLIKLCNDKTDDHDSVKLMKFYSKKCLNENSTYYLLMKKDFGVGTREY